MVGALRISTPTQEPFYHHTASENRTLAKVPHVDATLLGVSVSFVNLSPLWVDILHSGFANQFGSVAKLGTPPITNAHETFYN